MWIYVCSILVCTHTRTMHTCQEIDFYLTGQIHTCGMQHIIPLFSDKLAIGFSVLLFIIIYPVIHLDVMSLSYNIRRTLIQTDNFDPDWL